MQQLYSCSLVLYCYCGDNGLKMRYFFENACFKERNSNMTVTKKLKYNIINRYNKI